MTIEQSPHSADLSESSDVPLQQTIKLLSSLVHTRLALAGLELGEARDALVSAIFGLALTLLLAGLALLTLSIAVTLLFWDTWRWQSLAVLSATYLAMAVLVGWRLRRQLRLSNGFMHATLSVLEKDKQAWSQT